MHKFYACVLFVTGNCCKWVTEFKWDLHKSSHLIWHFKYMDCLEPKHLCSKKKPQKLFIQSRRVTIVINIFHSTEITSKWNSNKMKQQKVLTVKQTNTVDWSFFSLILLLCFSVVCKQHTSQIAAGLSRILPKWRDKMSIYHNWWHIATADQLPFTCLLFLFHLV